MKTEIPDLSFLPGLSRQRASEFSVLSFSFRIFFFCCGNAVLSGTVKIIFIGLPSISKNIFNISTSAPFQNSFCWFLQLQPQLSTPGSCGFPHVYWKILRAKIPAQLYCDNVCRQRTSEGANRGKMTLWNLSSIAVRLLQLAVLGAPEGSC